MSLIEYKKMSLFDVPSGSMLIHACNAKGVWGSGIARVFKEKYPQSFEQYRNYCLKYSQDAVGRAFICGPENGNTVVCLITSYDFGARRDNRDAIVMNTTLAVQNFLDTYLGNSLLRERPIYSNKFNSGLFDLKWESSELVLNKLLSMYVTPPKWTVVSIE